MKKVWLALTLSFSASAYTECVTEISCPTYCGGFYGGGSYLYLRPAPSDGDLEYGSRITLTDDPANLTAILLENRPGYESAFTVNLGYRFPCSNQNLEVDYLYFSGSDSDKTEISTRNQFIQNFLGASYSTSKSSERQRLHQVDLTYGANFLFDDCLDLHPFLSLRYADVRRQLSVKYDDLVLNPFFFLS